MKNCLNQRMKMYCTVSLVSVKSIFLKMEDFLCVLKIVSIYLFLIKIKFEAVLRKKENHFYLSLTSKIKLTHYLLLMLFRVKKPDLNSSPQKK